MESFLEKALSEGHLRIDQSARFEKIVYAAVNRSERWSDSEEKVRAEFYAELVYRYGYSPDRIGVEVTVPDRSPNDFADLVVFKDDERKRPFAVIECKKEAISDAEFTQAVTIVTTKSLVPLNGTEMSSLTCHLTTVSHPRTNTVRASATNGKTSDLSTKVN